MKRSICISIILFSCFVWMISFGQNKNAIHPEMEMNHAADTSLLKKNSLSSNVKSGLAIDTAKFKHPLVNKLDTTGGIYYWNLTENTGERVNSVADTALYDFHNRAFIDGYTLASAYNGNLGSPMQTRIFFDRPEASNFLFSDGYYKYMKDPYKYNFINTKIPYSNAYYSSGGSGLSKEERFMGSLSINFGKKLNVGFDLDYLYARGMYTSQSAKHFDYVMYGTYISDRHQVHVFINPSTYTNAENGGITDDSYITDPQAKGSNITPLDIPINYNGVWNRQGGDRYMANYRYNVGFDRSTNKKDSTGNTIKEFIPVASLIYNLDYDSRHRVFNASASGSSQTDTYYGNRNFLKSDSTLDDRTSYWEMKNTVGISLRQGFRPWAIFDLTAYLRQEVRHFTMQDSLHVYTYRNNGWVSQRNILDYYNQQSTYLGGEIRNSNGKYLRYNASVDLGMLGYNLGDFVLKGNLETRIPLFGDTVSLSGNAYVRNEKPVFYEQHFHSRYFWWDNNFSTIKRIYAGGVLDIPQTRTNFSLGVENLSNYVYFDSQSVPRQYTGNVQVIAARVKQKISYRALHFDNDLAYQKSSNLYVLPLPDLSLYSTFYLQFLVSKVMRMQLGAGMHYFTDYYSPVYEPATQQFHVQSGQKIGNYPLVDGFANLHLKYTRFFLEFYNLGASVLSQPKYFSMPHYPLNPMFFKFGLSWDFHN